MQIFTIAFLLCVATAFGYGNVEILSTEHRAADNSVLGGESHFHSTFDPSETPTTEVHTTGAPLPTYSTTEESHTTSKVPVYPHTPTGPHEHATRTPHHVPTSHSGVHPNQYHPLHHYSHIAPYHSFGGHPFWYHRYNSYGMQRPFMMSPYAGLQSHPMPPLVIVKLLQPIVLPVARNVHEEKSPKAEIDIDMERITHHGHHYNRFGHKEGHGRFVQSFNHLGQDYNRFGHFGSMGQGMSPFTMNRFGNGFNQFGHGMSPMGMHGFGNGFNQFGHHGMSHMGMHGFGNQYGHHGMSHGFTQQPHHFHQGFARVQNHGFGSARFGRPEHSSPMDEDQDMHITVKLN